LPVGSFPYAHDVILAISATAAREDAGLRLFRFIPGYDEHIVLTGKEPLILMLLAFLITFALTRLYTRLARFYAWGSGSVHGVHLHHMVVGIIMVLTCGLVGIASDPGQPWLDIVAVVFGVGAALTLDEFALWLYFRDVYWSEEGRSSIDAAIMGLVFAGLCSSARRRSGSSRTRRSWGAPSPSSFWRPRSCSP
jgi:hypothetical protein